MLGKGSSNLVNTQVKAFFWHLCGNDERTARVHPVEHSVLKRETLRIGVFRNATNAKGLNNHGVVTVLKGGENLRAHARHKFENKDTLVEGVIKNRLLNTC